MTATADYGTSIVEDFAPPKAMTPGENVNKDVSVVNTGSIDAFTRVALENQLEITKYGSEDFTIDNFVNTTKPYYTIKKTTVTYGEADKANANDVVIPTTAATGVTYATYQDSATSKYGLKTTKEEELAEHYATEAARDADENKFELSNPDVGSNNVPGSVIYTYSDGAGGTDTSIKSCTVTNPADMSKGVKLTTSQSLNEDTGKLTPNEVTTLQAGGTIVMAASKILPKSEQFVVAGDDTTPPTQIDYDGVGQYTPGTAGAGLYIFKRTVYEGSGNNETKYSGYYYDGTDFYALKTEVTETTTGSVATPYIDFGTGNTGFLLDGDGQITDINGTISLLTKETYKTDGFADTTAGIGVAAVTPEFGKLTVSDGAADVWAGPITGTDNINNPANVNAVKLNITTGSNTNGTVIYIKLADGWTDHWKVVEPTGAADSVADWFYYKDTVKSGETTEKLVDYVRIDNTVNQTDYVDLTYDLNVVLDSVQVTHNDEGDETAAAVPNTWATPTLTTTPVNNNGNVSVITAVDWN